MPSPPDALAVGLTFLNAAGAPLAEATAPLGSRLIDTIRRLTQQNRLQTRWRCAQGTCGSCLVHIEHAQSGRPITLSALERNVLIRHGHLPAESAAQTSDVRQTPRLACHVHCQQDMLVYLPVNAEQH